MRGYFDHNASSPLRPEVGRVMAETMAGAAGNPSSMHREGRLARSLLDEARARVAAMLDCPAEAVLFTSGATESNNLAIRGLAAAQPGLRLISSRAEHASVRGTVEDLGAKGRDSVLVEVDDRARPDSRELSQMAAERPALLAFGWANSESGHLADIGSLVRSKGPGCRLHLDAAQACGRVPVRLSNGIDSLALSAHKFGGPRGVGALALEGTGDLGAIMSGGGQEKGLRPGTENLAGIVGMGLAARLATEELESEGIRLRELREELWLALSQSLAGLLRISPEDGLPGTLTVALAGLASELLVAALDMEGFAVSTGSACLAGTPEPSQVMAALKVPSSHRNGVLRISMGWNTRARETRALAGALVRVAERARSAAYKGSAAQKGSAA